MNNTTYKQIEELRQAGYRIEDRDYYNPGGNYTDKTVIYPDGSYEQYSPHLRKYTIAQQWELAWLHYISYSAKQS